MTRDEGKEVVRRFLHDQGLLVEEIPRRLRQARQPVCGAGPQDNGLLRSRFDAVCPRHQERDRKTEPRRAKIVELPKVALRPAVLLFDEPCSALDPVSAGVIE
ncbi:MAG: hypothetical protein ACREXX_14505, partial [Gammaproteobacteria bacterium]